MLGQCGGVVGLLDLGDVQSNKCSLEHALSMYPTSMTCKEALWLKKLLSDLYVPCDTLPILCDNQGAMKLLKHAIASMRSKHIDVQYLFAREHVARGNVAFHYCNTERMIADCMTKPLPEKKLVFCRLGMGVMN